MSARHLAPAAPAPRPSLPSQFHIVHSTLHQCFVPFGSHRVLPFLLVGVRDKSSRFWALAPGHIGAGTFAWSWRFCAVFHVGLSGALGVLWAPLGHTPVVLAFQGREGLGDWVGEWSPVLAAATSLCVLCWSLGLKIPSGFRRFGVRPHSHTIGFSRVCHGSWVFVIPAVHNGCICSSVAHLDPSVLQVTVDAISAEAGASSNFIWQGGGHPTPPQKPPPPPSKGTPLLVTGWGEMGPNP